MLSLLSGTARAGRSQSRGCVRQTLALSELVSFPWSLGTLGSVCTVKVASHPALRFEQSEGRVKE